MVGEAGRSQIGASPRPGGCGSAHRAWHPSRRILVLHELLGGVEGFDDTTAHNRNHKELLELSLLLPEVAEIEHRIDPDSLVLDVIVEPPGLGKWTD